MRDVFVKPFFKDTLHVQVGKLGCLAPSPLALPNAERHGEKRQVRAERESTTTHLFSQNTENHIFRFDAGISAAVREGGGRTVLDLGAGTGLLSLMAVRAGADRVYACEASEVSDSSDKKMIF